MSKGSIIAMTPEEFVYRENEKKLMGLFKGQVEDETEMVEAFSELAVAIGEVLQYNWQLQQQQTDAINALTDSVRELTATLSAQNPK